MDRALDCGSKGHRFKSCQGRIHNLFYMKHFSLRATLSQGIRLLKSNWLVFLGFGVIASALVAVWSAFVDGRIWAGTLTSMQVLDGGSVLLPTFWGWVASLLFLFTLFSWGIVVSKIALNRMDSKKWKDNFLLSWHQWGKLFVANVFVFGAIIVFFGITLTIIVALANVDSVVTTLMALVVAALGIVGFFYVIARFLFYNLYIVDKDMGIIEAFRTSARITKHTIVRVVLLVVFLMAVAEVPGILVSEQGIVSYGVALGLAIVVWLLTQPLVVIIQTIAYRTLSSSHE